MHFFSKIDPFLFFCSFVLISFGLATIASVAPEVFWSQFILSILGFVGFVIISNIDFDLYRPYSRIIYVVSLFGLVATILFGIASHGAVRWIQLGPMRLQFSEIFKPLLIIAFSDFLMSRNKGFKKTILSLLWQLPIVVLIFRQPDLGGSLVYLAGFAMMMIASGIDLKSIVALLSGGLISLPIGWKFLADYQKNRIITFLNPKHDVLGTSYNAVQAVITVGSGMLFGKGLGRGTQSHLFFLPEKHTDFIFASFSEEFGFVGAFMLLLTYFILFNRLIQIMSNTTDRFGRAIIAGVLGMLLFQTTVNIGMNIGIVPVTGITLPLVSYGGSSVLATLASLAIISNIGSKTSKSHDY